MKKLILIKLLFVLVICKVYGQNNTIDSLQKVLLSQQEDTNKVNTFLSISDACSFNNNIQKAIENGQKALALAQRLHFSKGEINAYLAIGVANLGISNIPEAMDNYFKALKIAESIKNTGLISEVYQFLSAGYSLYGEYNESLKYLNLSLQINKNTNNKGGMASDLNGISINLMKLGDYEKVLDKVNAAKKLYEELGDKSPAWGLAFCYKNLGDVFDKQGDVAKINNDKILSRNKYIQALENYEIALLKYQNSKLVGATGVILIDKGRINLKLGNLSVSRQLINKAFQSGELDKFYKQDVYSTLSTIDSLEGNYKDALRNYHNYIDCRDSIYSNSLG